MAACFHFSSLFFSFLLQILGLGVHSEIKVYRFTSKTPPMVLSVQLCEHTTHTTILLPVESEQDGSMDKGACCLAQRSEFDPWGAGGRRNNSHNDFTHRLYYMCPSTCMHTNSHKEINESITNSHKKINKSIIKFKNEISEYHQKIIA